MKMNQTISEAVESSQDYEMCQAMCKQRHMQSIMDIKPPPLLDLDMMGSSNEINLHLNPHIVPHHQTDLYSFILPIILIACSIFAMIAYYLKPRGYRLHFVGIARPSNFEKSSYKLLDNVDAESLISIQTTLNTESTICELKKVIRQTYGIADQHDIMIVFSHHIITENDSTLQTLGIADNALLTLAICADTVKVVPPPIEPAAELPEPTPEPEPVIEEYESESESETDSDYPDEVNNLFQMYESDEDVEETPEPVADVNELFGMFKNYQSDDDEEQDDEPEVIPTPEPTPPPPTWPRLGFDIIMQEDDVMVHKMPTCGHEMNSESLYHYALNTWKDAKNLHLTCPHSNHRTENGKCGARWHYNEIMDVLKYEEEQKHSQTTDKWLDFAKLELLAARNMVQNKFDVQKCPRCQSLYYKNYDVDKMALEDIKSKEEIEKQFKFGCVLCRDEVEKTVTRIPINNEPPSHHAHGRDPNAFYDHNEDEIEEVVDAAQLNAMFGMEQDSDSEDESDDDQDEEEDALLAIADMFDHGDSDDEYEALPEFEEEVESKVLNEFCFCCGHEWDKDHVCDSTFKSELVEILELAERKKIGSVKDVPSIRCCPNCCQLIFHIEACKHMDCNRCGISFCFVCLKPTLNGAWQCGSHSDVCPVAPPQNEEALPDTVVITKKSFQLYQST